MSDARNPLLSRRLAAICAVLEAGSAGADSLWQEAAADYATTEKKDADVEQALAQRDLAAFRKIVEQWEADRKPLPLEDRTLLKRAMKAFRKRLKVTRLDDESRLGVGATTRGERSHVVGITPPQDYAAEVWKELARQKRLKDIGRGLYELVD